MTYGREYSGATIGAGLTSGKTSSSTPLLGPVDRASGMVFYTGDRYPEWKGNLFVGSLVQKLSWHRSRGRQGGEGGAPLRRQSPDPRRPAGADGYLYLLTRTSRPRWDGSCAFRHSLSISLAPVDGDGGWASVAVVLTCTGRQDRVADTALSGRGFRRHERETEQQGCPRHGAGARYWRSRDAGFVAEGAYVMATDVDLPGVVDWRAIWVRHVRAPENLMCATSRSGSTCWTG